MLPVIFEIGNLKISGYLFFNFLGIFISSVFILFYSKNKGLDLTEVFSYLIYAWIVFIFTSQLYSPFLKFLKSPAHFVKNIKTSLVLNGHSLFSGLFFASLFSYLYLKKVFKEKSNIIGTLSVIGFSFYQSIGKLGCFSAGCCYGKPTSFFLGVKFKYLGNSLHPFYGLKIHPTQLYESFFDFLNFTFLLFLFKKGNKNIVPYYFLNFGLIRFFEEYLRGDAGRGFIFKGKTVFSSLSLPQSYSLIMILIGAAFILGNKNKK